VKDLVEAKEFLPLRLEQPRHRDACPSSNNFRHFFGRDFFVEKRLRAFRDAR
jgi:hypothetical protein